MNTTAQTTAIVTETPRVVSVLPTKNPKVFQLMVRSEREKPLKEGNDGDFNIFMAGFAVNEPERLVAYRTVSDQYLDAYGINYDEVTGDVLSPEGYTTLQGLKRQNNDETFPPVHPECKIWVNETFEPRSWMTSDGSKRTQTPKINPKTNEVLCNQGNKIYLNRELTFDVSKEDVYISHDGTQPVQAVANVSSSFGDLSA
tara:strand:+ start:3198 stop:3797 length:600 start_codon:yes stop_codon:yes gene_type:complete